MLQVIRTLIFTSLLSISIHSDVNIDKHLRESGSVDLTSGSIVTGMPYGYFVGQFGKSSIKGYNEQNLSGYDNKKLLIGYGVYDIKNENCRYLDVPSNKNFKIDFDKIFTLNNSTYGISRTKMTYSQCLAKAATYSGFIFTPKDSVEMGTTTRHFDNDKDIWLGYSRASCLSPYKNNENFEQTYENFQFPVETCDDTKLVSYKPENSYQWLRSGSGDSHYCAIKINSPDYLRPIQFCMPWWRVERQYKLNSNEDIFEFNNERYDMKYAQYIMDYPKDEIICSVLNTPNNISGTFKSSIRVKNNLGEFSDVDVACSTSQNVSINDFATQFQASCSPTTDATTYSYFTNTVKCINSDPNNGISTANCKQYKSNYEMTCNSYDSITESPVCIDDISQDVCHVNECKGYIENVCTKKSSYTPFKDYDVGYIKVDGIQTRVKTKENKQIHTYSCPPPSPSDSNCLQKDSVIVFPAHCPGSECDELATCLKDKTKTADVCMETYPCEKSYGSVDNIIRDGEGIAIALGGVCKDGSQIQASIEIKDTIKKTCNSYDEYNQTTQQYRTCISNIESSNKIISTSITADDEYSLNERCIRTNNLEESRPSVRSVFDYTTKGFFKTAIQKAYIDNTDETYDSNNSVEYILNSSSIKVRPIVPLEINTTSVQQDNSEQLKCDAIFSQTWQNRFLGDSDTNPYPSLIGILQQNTTGGAIEKCASDATLQNDRCEYNTPACGTYTYQSSDDTCRDSSQNIKTFDCSNYESRTGNTCYGTKWYNYPIIAISSDKNTCDSYKASLGFTQNTLGNVFFEDYDFATINITQAQINNKQYCIIGENMVQGDEIFGAIHFNVDEAYYTSKNSIDKDTCKQYASCVNGDVTSLQNQDVSLCTIHAGDDTGNVENGSEIAPYEKVSIGSPSESRGTFNGNIDGYSDIFAVQEYTEGEFGYFSNYLSELPVNNIVLLNDKEISPIIEQTSIVYDLSYDYHQRQNNLIVKNENPELATAIMGPGVSMYGQYAGFAYLHMAAVGAFAIMAYYGKKQKFGWYDSNYALYQDLGSDLKYVPNLYGYDPRILQDGRLVWYKQDIGSGTLKENSYLSFRTSIIDEKKDLFKMFGFSNDTINEKLISDNERTFAGWEHIKRWKLHAKKLKVSDNGYNTNQPSKPINTIFMGAVNSLSIVVPYKGDFEVKAYDANDNLLATKIVQEQNFISNIPSTTGNLSQTFAKVQFATADDFNIAPGQNTSLDNGSCLSSNFVEWGGGVSGAYYEKGVPDIGLGSDCLKSNDYYVKSHSATKISIRALNSSAVFLVNLKKPLPFPNRVVLVNLMQLENRKYECWADMERCTVINESGEEE